MRKLLWVSISFLLFTQWANAGVEGSISGTITDPDGVSLGNAKVQLVSPQGQVVKETTASPTGTFGFFPVTFGDYKVTIDLATFDPFTTSVHVTSGSTTQVDAHLSPAGTTSGKEMVINVQAKRKVINNTASSSSTDIQHETIEKLPGGNDISFSRLLETTSPGVVQGPFNQLFIRGNHANLQYQIDGVQLPDSTSGVFADAFSPRNIDHMELITGGIPAEYGERLAAVANIVTKSGPETPGGTVELNYGSYNTFAPQASYEGSNKAGDIHYFFSANYNSTDRGLDTPEPSNTSFAGQTSGGTDAVHDASNGNNQFMKIDWLPDNDDKISFILFQNYDFYQIPNFPSSFSPTDPYFSGPNYTDFAGNNNPGSPSPFIYTPADTNDTQSNQDAYAQVVWKRTLSEHSFLQIAPYWKYSKIKVTNDPANDLISYTLIPGSSPDSFNLDRHVNNEGLKADYSLRPNDVNFFKAGFQVQASQANDGFGITGVSPTSGLLATTTGGGVDKGYTEAAYVQDDLTISKPLTLNAGIRFTDVQYNFSDGSSPSYYQFQPRIGLNYMATEETKLHAFYGRLFMPAPLEDLRDAFSAFSATQVSFYNIKPEKDNYYEVGVDQQLGTKQVATLNVYYKSATDMLDDTQLLNTSIASPFNYTNGYAYGVELSVRGKITEDLSEYFNYSYEIAKGENISGGNFAFSPSSLPPPNTYTFLDHVQVHTANTGLIYSKDQYFASTQGLFGSGLRTGANNISSLPSHFSFDLSGGYEFKGQDWFSKCKVSGDIFNVFNNTYPITIANGYNGSHYEAGREFFVRLTKDL